MKSNRRSVLIGLGALTVGGGAVFGTGAFSSVDAERSVSVSTAGDASGLIELDVNDDFNGISDDSETGTNGENIIGISLEDINDNAEFTFDDALTITNQGSESVDITVEADLTGLSFEVNDGTAVDANGGEATVDITVDTNEEVEDGDITITATTN